jgi:hypothetical protein
MGYQLEITKLIMLDFRVSFGKPDCARLISVCARLAMPASLEQHRGLVILANEARCLLVEVLVLLLAITVELSCIRLHHDIALPSAAGPLWVSPFLLIWL